MFQQENLVTFWEGDKCQRELIFKRLLVILRTTETRCFRLKWSPLTPTPHFMSATSRKARAARLQDGRKRPSKPRRFRHGGTKHDCAPWSSSNHRYGGHMSDLRRSSEECNRPSLISSPCCFCRPGDNATPWPEVQKSRWRSSVLKYNQSLRKRSHVDNDTSQNSQNWREKWKIGGTSEVIEVKTVTPWIWDGRSLLQ